MKKLIALFLLITMISCSPFHQLAKETKIGIEEGYTSVTNSTINLKSLTFGDFKFATKNKDYKKIKTDSTLFDNILFYAKTVNPSYDYYVLMDPVDTLYDLKKYELEKTIINDHKFFLLISKDAPFGDAKFIRNNLTAE